MVCNLSVNSLEKGKERKGRTTGKGRGLRRDRERKEEPETVFVPKPPVPLSRRGLPGLGVVCDQMKHSSSCLYYTPPCMQYL